MVRLEPREVTAELGGRVRAGALPGGAWGAGAVGLGPLEVEISPAGDLVAGRGGWSWSLANRSDAPVRVRSVGLVMAVEGAEPLRMWRHGYQSWSPSGVATFGSGRDASRAGGAELLRAAHHADQRSVAGAEELRSEWVTILADPSADCLLVGFESGGRHDGTLRLRRGTSVELVAEAFLDVELGGGEALALHPVVVRRAGQDPASVAGLLGDWAAAAGQAAGARVGSAFQVGWCSWYHYFHGVTGSDVDSNLARAGDWPFEVFQVDDGYQSAIGDWLTTNERFPGGVEAMAGRISAAGFRPGLWLAPFLVAPDSRTATQHPDWLARWDHPDGSTRPLVAWFNPSWGGGRGGRMYCLDTTLSEVQAHLEAVARAVVGMGYRYLKLDFTFAPSVEGVWSDRTRTPAQRVRDGFAAIRRGAGEEAFILGCGAPLSHAVGLVDGMRIGQDVAPRWDLEPEEEVVPGYLRTQPAVRFAYSSTLARAFMHRLLWLNDPDCVMLRSTSTQLSERARLTWARTVGLSGGMVLVSDDLSLLDPGAASLLREVLDLGRQADAAARGGPGAPGRPTAADLLREEVPTDFRAAGRRLVTDPVGAGSVLSAT